MFASVVIAVFDREGQAQDNFLFALLKLSRGSGNFIGEVGSAVIKLSDGEPELDKIAQPDTHLHRLRTLRQKIGGAGFKGLHANLVGLDRGNHHDWNIGELRKRTKFTDESYAVHFRHLVIHERDVEIAFACGRHCLHGVQEGRGLNQAIRLDESLQKIEDGAAVIDEQRLSKHWAVSLRGGGIRNRPTPKPNPPPLTWS